DKPMVFLRFLLVIIALPLTEIAWPAPYFSVSNAAGKFGDEVTLAVSLSVGDEDVRRAAASLRYDPSRLKLAFDCDLIIFLTLGTVRPVCVDYPDLGLIEISLAPLEATVDYIPSGELGKLRFLLIREGGDSQFRPSAVVEVSQSSFFGARGVVLDQGEPRNGKVFAFRHWPLDDNEALDDPSHPVFLSWEGISRRLLGGRVSLPLTFHAAGDEDWLALPGDRVGSYELSSSDSDSAYRISVYDMNQRLANPDQDPLQNLDFCRPDTTQLRVATRSDLLLRLTRCEWAAPAAYEVLIADNTLPALNEGEWIEVVSLMYRAVEGHFIQSFHVADLPSVRLIPEGQVFSLSDLTITRASGLTLVVAPRSLFADSFESP
ncbi:MAG: hypothetical protein AAGA23_05820, partial [Pseudomonadota bacterium]